MFAAPSAENVWASAGNCPFETVDVGASCTTCAVSAEEYQVTMRCDSSAPTPRMTPVRFTVSAAWAGVAARAPTRAEVQSAAAASHAVARVPARRGRADAVRDDILVRSRD